VCTAAAPVHFEFKKETKNLIKRRAKRREAEGKHRSRAAGKCASSHQASWQAERGWQGKRGRANISSKKIAGATGASKEKKAKSAPRLGKTTIPKVNVNRTIIDYIVQNFSNAKTKKGKG